MSFGVFGLGNKQYEHFCAVGKRVHKALCALGGNALVRRGDGDDDEDIEADFDSWRAELYDALDKSDVLAKNAVGPAVVCFCSHRTYICMPGNGYMHTPIRHAGMCPILKQ